MCVRVCQLVYGACIRMEIRAHKRERNTKNYCRNEQREMAKKIANQRVHCSNAINWQNALAKDTQRNRYCIDRFSVFNWPHGTLIVPQGMQRATTTTVAVILHEQRSSLPVKLPMPGILIVTLCRFARRLFRLFFLRFDFFRVDFCWIRYRVPINRK